MWCGARKISQVKSKNWLDWKLLVKWDLNIFILTLSYIIIQMDDDISITVISFQYCQPQASTSYRLKSKECWVQNMLLCTKTKFVVWSFIFVPLNWKDDTEVKNNQTVSWHRKRHEAKNYVKSVYREYIKMCCWYCVNTSL